MKRYIKSAIEDSCLDIIQKDIEDYIDDYYGTLGYEEGYVSSEFDVIWPSDIDGKPVYEIVISLDTLDTRDAKDICQQLDILAGSNGLPVKLYKPFSYDGEYTFIGYIIER